MSALLDKYEAGMYVSDYYTGEMLYVNQKMSSYGNGRYTARDMLGKPCWSFFNYIRKGRCPFCPYEKLLKNGNEFNEPYEWVHYFPGYDVWLKIISEATTWIDGRIAHVVTFYDITDLKKTQELLADLAFIDQQLFIKNGIKLEHDMKESSYGLSLIALDIIELQKINDLYGRTIGDKLLIAVRDWLFNLNTPNCELYRVGGDEFCLAFDNISMESIQALANDLFQRFYMPWDFQINDSKFSILCDVSIGIIHSSYNHEKESTLNLVEHALKNARCSGAATIYNDEADKLFKNQLVLEWSLKNSIQDNMNGFIVYYQPIVDSKTGRWLGLEALCRWNSPELGQVPPLVFIPEAERLALINKIGLWVLETAICSCKAWKLDTCQDFILNVNLSSIQFLDEMLATKILDLLKKYDYPNEKLCLEITESNRFIFSDLSLKTIKLFKESHILIALDDFGTGYSNFSNLEALHINIIKIERTFAIEIENNSFHQYMFRAIADLAHATSKKLIAEGVERKTQIDLLVENGADFLQGYFFSMPIPPNQIEQQLWRFYNNT